MPSMVTMLRAFIVGEEAAAQLAMDCVGIESEALMHQSSWFAQQAVLLYDLVSEDLDKDLEGAL